MLKDGTYAAWFKTSKGEGTGIAILRDGKVTGGDSILTYSGSYETEGHLFRAVIRTHRHSPGHPTIFGVDNLTLRLNGTCRDAVASCSGRADETPGELFEATLILSRPDDRKPTSEPSINDFHPERLPRLPPRKTKW